MTSWRSIYWGATPQTSYNAHGKIVNDDDTILPIDGSVLVGDGKDVPEGSYMNLETGKVQLECVSEEPSSRPATWTCVPQTADGNKAIIETFDRVDGDSDRCDTFAEAVVPTTSHPVAQPQPDDTAPTFATCTTCSMLACLLSPTNGTCQLSDEDCITTVVDQSAGREITRGCAIATDPDNDLECDDIETRVLSSGVTCRYYCDGKTHPNCNKPPQLLPQSNTLISFP